jgi:hypothetical protein
MNNNQHNALFIFRLLIYHTSTGFGCISSPSSGDGFYVCIYINISVCVCVCKIVLVMLLKENSHILCRPHARLCRFPAVPGPLRV